MKKQSSAHVIDWISTQQAAKILRVTRIRVCQLIAEYSETRGKTGIHAKKLGPHAWMCDKASVLAYRKNRRPPGRPPAS